MLMHDSTLKFKFQVCCPFDTTSFRIQPVEFTVTKVTSQKPEPNPVPKPVILSILTKKPEVDNIDKTIKQEDNKTNENISLASDGTCGIDSSSGNKIFGKRFVENLSYILVSFPKISPYLLLI